MSPGKPVFAHYMVGGIDENHIIQDIHDALDVGFDAFALNFDQIKDWSSGTVQKMFANAEAIDGVPFKLFFSFDMAPGHFSTPSEYSDFLNQYIHSPAYFNFNGKPLVTTFGGESVSEEEWSNLKSSSGDMILMPGFYESVPDQNYLDSHPSIDGIFNWNSWADESAGKVVVPTQVDQTFQTLSASNGDNFFMMGMSPLQFKHIDGGQNWYRRGEHNFEERIGQVLQMQPDMLEVQTWNDAGESHYIGNSWPEPIPSSIKAYTTEYDHRGYWEVLKSFIQAWKRGDTDTSHMVPTNGKAAQGVFYHHTLLTTSTCPSDPMGPPRGLDNVEDIVAGIILVAENQAGLHASVQCDDRQLGVADLSTGYNMFNFAGLSAGVVNVTVFGPDGMVVSGVGPIAVTDTAALYNYNFQVVGLS